MHNLSKSLLLVILLFLLSCKKDDPTPELLPPATQEGKNTFGCYLNGNVWVPYTYALFSRKIKLSRGNPTVIEAQHYENPDAGDKQTIRILFYPDHDDPLRTYIFGFGERDASVSFFDRQACYYNYDTEEFMEGSLTITKYDLLEEKIISGTFEFTLGKEDCDTLYFTDGRFDIPVR